LSNSKFENNCYRCGRLKIDKFFACALALIVIAIAVFCILMYIFPTRANQDTGNKVIASYGEGKLYKAGSVYISELHGSYRDMGRQYGALRKADLKTIYDVISGDFGKTSDLTYDNFLEYGRLLFQYYPERYKQMLYGMSETSGLDMDKILIVSVTEGYISMKNGLPEGCSGVAAWGNYTADGTLIFGRNYDWGPSLRQYANVVVLNPNDGSIPYASITYTGCVYATSAINKQGIFLELNDGGLSRTGVYDNRSTWYASLQTIIENSRTLGDVDRYFNALKPNSEFVINVADKNISYSYEWGLESAHRRSPDYDGLLAATNHFVDSYLCENETTLAQKDNLYSIIRRQNLLNWGNRCKGNITEDMVKQMVSTPIENGGAFFANPPLTAYEIIVIPQKLKIAVRIPGVQEWVDIDLNRYFT
jgi:hypothetical protein